MQDFQVEFILSFTRFVTFKLKNNFPFYLNKLPWSASHLFFWKIFSLRSFSRYLISDALHFSLCRKILNPSFITSEWTLRMYPWGLPYFVILLVCRTAHSYNILMTNVIPFHSHLMTTSVIANMLVERGHNVTLITIKATQPHPNLTVVNIEDVFRLREFHVHN